MFLAHFVRPCAALLALASLGVLPARAGGPIVSGQVVTGSVASPSFADTWTFTGTSGNRVLVAAVSPAGAMNTNIILRSPAGTVVYSNSSDRAEFLLTATGIWSIVVEDLGLNDSGMFTLSLLNVTAGPLTHPNDLDGGAISSGEVRMGQSSPITDFDAFTFSGTAGDRVVLAAIATAGDSYNTMVYLYPPAGGAAETFTGTDRIDHVLRATGTYTILVEDGALDHTGSYSLSLINLTAGPITLPADPDGGGIASGETKLGTIGTIPDFDAFRFTGTGGQRIVLGGVATSGALNTNLYLYPPGGGAATFVTSGDRVDYMLPSSGEWTILVEDSGTDATGGYALSLLNLTGGPLTTAADPNGGPIGSGEVKAGQSNVVTDFDAFTFAGTAGDRVVVAAIATGGVSYNTQFYIYPPAGGAAETFTGGDRLDHMLGSTGTYTILIEDGALDHTGSYSLSFMNLTAGPLTTAADPDGGTISSATTKTGTIGTTPDFDAYRFFGSNGDRVLIGGVATGAGLNTNLYLYPPGNGPPTVVTSGDRVDRQLNATGQWTLLIEDFGNDAIGPYALSLLNVTDGPLVAAGDTDGGPIASNEIRAGQINAVTDFDAFTFSGTAGNRVVATAVATGGTSFNTTVYLYPPNGGPFETFTGADRIDQRLAATGVYTIVIEDANLDHTGTYSVALLNVTAGPLTSANDPDGGFITSGTVRNGTVSAIADMDGFWFPGTPGDTAKISAVATSGLLNTNVYIYPPLGAAPTVITSADNVVFPVTVSGTHTILIEDFGMDHTGNYTLTLTGPLRTVDVPGGPIGPLDPVRVVFRTAFPNPSSRSASLTYSLPRPLPVRLTIYDVSGARVRILADETREAGIHTAVWDGRNERGDRTRSGLYYAVLRAGAETLRRKLVRVE